MNVSQLNRLGRWFSEVARTAAAKEKDPEMAGGEIAVLADVLTHPASSVGEIAERTGFVQSHVSASVANLREQGVLYTTTDAIDRRRTLVSVPEQVAQAIVDRADRQVNGALEAALGDGIDADRVIALIEELVKLVWGDGAADQSGNREGSDG